MKNVITLLCALMLAGSLTPLRAQARIEFDTKAHDFGTVSESGGDLTCQFTFRNTGDKPLLILRAQASCGCTTPAYTRKPVKPGETGTIDVTYHAKGRPGTFEKSVYVYDNSEPAHKTVLVISGNVLSNRSPEENFAHQLGAGLRVKNRALNFFDVYPNRANRTRTMEVYNESDTPMQLTFRGVPKHVSVQVDPEVIQPRKEGKVLVTFLTAKCGDWGLHKDKFEVLVKGRETAMRDNTIAVSADIWEDFSGLSRKDRAAAPQVGVSATVLDFVDSSTPSSLDVTIVNNGHSKLLIRKVQNDMPDVFVTTLDDTVVRPGQQTLLHVSFDPAGTPLRLINHHITLITNDPANPRVIINLTANP